MVGLMSEQFGTQRSGVAVDVIDDGDAFDVRADLPGYDAEDIDVTLQDSRTVRITAVRDGDDVDGRYVTRERRQRTADRTVTLPDAVASEETHADYDAGVLTVHLAKQSGDSEDGTDIPVN